MDMIQRVWPRTDVRESVPLCGDWKTIPLGDGSVPCVVGDGCFTLLDYPHGYRGVFREVQRVLSPGGRFAMRYFCRPTESESLAQIGEDLWTRRIGNADVLKLRLAMALHGTIQEGVAVDKIWRRFNEMVPERAKLELHLGWGRKEIDTFDVFRDSPAAFTFPTLEEIRDISSSLFVETSIHVPHYELGSRCPTVIYEPRQGGIYRNKPSRAL